MDVKPLQLVPITQEPVSRPQLGGTLAPDVVPSVQELREIEGKIIEHRKHLEQRMKLCDDQLLLVETHYNEMRERDRTKAKLLKKEPLDGQPAPLNIPKPTASGIHVTAPLLKHSPATPVLPPSSATVSKPVVRAGSAALRGDSTTTRPNKKKRKRVEDGDDVLHESGMRIGTPTTKGHGHKEHKSKKAKHDDYDLRTTAGGLRKIVDWSDSSKGGLPPKPPKVPLPVPQTDKPDEVNDDMSDRKQPPNQVTAHAYWNYIEPWTRQLKDEDVALLSFNTEDDDLWDVPPLGRHYSEYWEAEDRLTLDLPPSTKPSNSRPHNPYSAFTDPPPPSAGGSLQPVPNAGVRWDPASLTDQDTATEDHGSGPLTERIFSSFVHVPMEPRMEEDDVYRGGAGLGRAAGQGTVGDLEERLMKECKALGLILDSEEPDYSQPQDDQIISELRRCQKTLKNQLLINEARKSRLLAVAELRLAYADYEEVKEGMEKNIGDMFSRLGSAGAPKVTKKKKKEKDKVAAAAAVNANTGEPAGISGLGLVGMDGYLQIPNEIHEPVSVLRRWKADIGSQFEKLEAENPGLIRGLPKKSIYEGLEEEIAARSRSRAQGEGEAIPAVVTMDTDGRRIRLNTSSNPRLDSPDEALMVDGV